MALRVSTAVRFDPTFDHGQSAFKAYWTGHLGRSEMNKAIWKARLKMASPETRRAIVKDKEDRIAKYMKMKADLLAALAEGNQANQIKLLEIYQKDLASQRTLKGRQWDIAGGLQEQSRERQIQYESATPDPKARIHIDELPRRVGALIGKISPSVTGSDLMTDSNMQATYGVLKGIVSGAFKGGGSTPLKRDRILGELISSIHSLGSRDERGNDIRAILLHRLSQEVGLYGMRYKDYKQMLIEHHQKYGDNELGVTSEQLETIFEGGVGGLGSRVKAMQQMGIGGPAGGIGISGTLVGIDSQINRLSDELVKARAETEGAQKEFDWLLRGGMGNLALRPTASRLPPSHISDFLGKYGELHRADPEYAERYLTQLEEGEATEPITPYPELEEFPMTRYTSGADYLASSIGELSDMFGPTSAYAPEQAKQVARDKLLEMANAVRPKSEGGLGVLGEDPSKLKTKGREGRGFTETIDFAGGKKTITDVLQMAEIVLYSDESSEDQKNSFTEDAVTALTTQGYSQRQMPLKDEYRKATALHTNIADRIKSALLSKDTGDGGSYFGQLEQIYNDIVTKPSGLRGEIENKFMGAINQSLIDPSQKNLRYLDFSLRELTEYDEPMFGDPGDISIGEGRDFTQKTLSGAPGPIPRNWPTVGGKPVDVYFEDPEGKKYLKKQVGRSDAYTYELIGEDV